jgi:hypothetical protein
VETSIFGTEAVFETDRSITGQDGAGFVSAAQAAGAEGFAPRLAIALFEAVDGLDRVWVASNVVLAGRSAGWDGDAETAASGVIADFFVHYREEE